MEHNLKKTLSAGMCLWLIFLASFVPAWALPDSRNPADWYERAEEDWQVARLLREETPFHAAVCFHAHQAVEKALKGRWMDRGHRPPHTHRNTELAQKLFKSDPGLVRSVKDLSYLDSIYITSRYPKIGAKALTVEDAGACLEKAEAVLETLGLYAEVPYEQGSL